VNVSCSLPAAATTCSASPMSVAPGSSTMVTVTTTAHQSLAEWSIPRKFRTVPLAHLRLCLAAALVMIALSMVVCTSRRRWITSFCLAAAILALLFQSAGCGGGGGGTAPPPPQMFGTQPGAYTMTITGVSGTGNNALMHTITVTLVVN
jgi:hypothetical protein